MKSLLLTRHNWDALWRMRQTYSIVILFLSQSLLCIKAMTRTYLNARMSC
jgi:hypothetical protein